MHGKRGGHEVPDARMIASRGRSEPRDILIPMPPGQQEIGKDDDSRRSALGAACERRRNRRLGQLHVRRLDNRMAAAFGEVADNVEEHVVALRPPRTMVDEDDAELLCIAHIPISYSNAGNAAYAPRVLGDNN